MLANEGWRAAVVMSMNNVTSNALADISAERIRSSVSAIGMGEWPATSVFVGDPALKLQARIVEGWNNRHWCRGRSSGPIRSRRCSRAEGWVKSTVRATRGSVGSSRSGALTRLTAGSQALERFQREARAASTPFNHPNIYAIHDVGTDPPFIAMELLEVRRFTAAVRRGPIDLKSFFDIAWLSWTASSPHTTGIPTAMSNPRTCS